MCTAALLATSGGASMSSSASRKLRTVRSIFLGIVIFLLMATALVLKVATVLSGLLVLSCGALLRRTVLKLRSVETSIRSSSDTGINTSPSPGLLLTTLSKATTSLHILCFGHPTADHHRHFGLRTRSTASPLTGKSTSKDNSPR